MCSFTFRSTASNCVNFNAVLVVVCDEVIRYPSGEHEASPCEQRHDTSIGRGSSTKRKLVIDLASSVAV